MQKNYIESFLGIGIVILTLILLWTFFSRNELKTNGELISVTAYFQTVSGVSKGTDVKLGGVKVGRVLDVKLDPDSLTPMLVIGLDKTYKIPSDSSFAVKSEGIMGGKFISLEVGPGQEPIQEGQIFYNNQSSLDLESIVSQVVFGGEKKQ
jgi:phospholipid/cholesterol/gamma-HCH transport system substrate-binding protein